MSNRSIAEVVNVDEGTVRNDRKGIAENSAMPDRVTTSDGRSYPAKREPKVVDPQPDPQDGEQICDTL